jgi:hypothetical protein
MPDLLCECCQQPTPEPVHAATEDGDPLAFCPACIAGLVSGPAADQEEDEAA